MHFASRQHSDLFVNLPEDRLLLGPQAWAPFHDGPGVNMALANCAIRLPKAMSLLICNVDKGRMRMHNAIGDVLAHTFLHVGYEVTLETCIPDLLQHFDGKLTEARLDIFAWLPFRLPTVLCDVPLRHLLDTLPPRRRKANYTDTATESRPVPLNLMDGSDTILSTFSNLWLLTIMRPNA